MTPLKRCRVCGYRYAEWLDGCPECANRGPVTVGAVLGWLVTAGLLFIVIGGSFGYAAMQAWQFVTSSS